MRIAIVLVISLVASIAVAGPATVRGNEIVLAQPIVFASGTPDLSPGSRALLDAVAALLAKRTSIRLVEIQCHTDARGNDEWNLKLSQQRADAVLAYLVGKGTDARRLRARGYGETRPIAKGTNARAMAQNRRTVFLIQ